MSGTGSNAKGSGKRPASEDGNDTSSDASAPQAMTISSDEINFLVYRYLREAGFVHSAFTFAYESMLGRSSMRNAEKSIPPGALISFLQKGLQYVGIEESLHKDTSSSSRKNSEFNLLSSLQAMQRPNPPIQINVPPATAAAALRARLETQQQQQAVAAANVMMPQMNEFSPAAAAFAAQHPAAVAAAASPHHQAAAALASVVGDPRKDMMSGNSSSSAAATAPAAVPLHLQGGFAHLEEAVARLESQKKEEGRNGSGGRIVENKPDQNGDVVMQNSAYPLNGRGPSRSTELLAASALTGVSQQQPPAQTSSSNIDREDEATNAAPSEVLELKKHASEVFMCAWNPVFTDLIATGSGDASARIWQMNGPDAKAGSGSVRLLPHGTDPNDRKNKDVTTLEWSPDGMLLATGSYDGIARVWNRAGVLVHTLKGHQGPIFSLKWNRRGNFLLSGSYDKTTIVWDVSGSQGFIEQQFNDHFAPALDVDWKDDTTFASCSTDKTVNICRVGVARPLKTYMGHTDEVNAVKWDPSGMLLASCSDDCTAKVWDVESDRNAPLHDFKSHQQEIYTVKWSPTGPGSKNPFKERMLATASFDGSVRLWDVTNGTCIRVLSRHRDSVYSVAFSPSGDYLASGSLAGQLYIWDVREGTVIKSYKGSGDIFEVAWNAEETRVAACFSSNVVSIIDFKPKQQMLTNS